VKLWGVYHANGGLVGELAYVWGKLRGTAHCGLCDITHGRSVRKKAEWQELEQSLDVPIELVHLNERPPALQAATEGSTPCVVAETESGYQIILGPDELDDCDAAVDCFEGALRRALDRLRERGET
jgi:hypothetical protein